MEKQTTYGRKKNMAIHGKKENMPIHEKASQLMEKQTKSWIEKHSQNDR